ncbi:MAG: FtsQ-type POTRA domain-containing protein [Acidobacteriota bacterium]
MKPLPMDQQPKVAMPAKIAVPANDSTREPVRRDEGEKIVPFRRRRGKVERLRRSPLKKFLRPFLLALVIVGLPACVIAWPMVSPRFAFQELTVDTGDRVSEAWVRQTLQPLIGTNLLLLSLPQAEHMLRQHPWVESCDLRKVLPAGLIVRITEKQAEALLSHDKKLFYLDGRGVPIAPFDPHAGASDLMLISRLQTPSGDPAEPMPAASQSSLRSAIQLTEEITQLDPPWRDGLSEIVVLGENDFKIYTTSLPFPLLVRVGTLKDKVRRLEELLPKIVDHYGRTSAIDLRFARRIIVQPSVETAAITTDRRDRRQI